MNETKSIFSSKTVWGILFAAIAPWLSKKLGLQLDDTSQQQIVEAVMVAIGSATAIYGRVSAKSALSIPVVKPPAALLALSLAAGIGCATWEGFSPTTQAVLKAGAKLALSYGISELGDRVKEVRPFQGQLNGLIQTTFSQPLSAEETGSALKAGVAKLPEPLQAPVLAQFKESLAGSKTTAASPGNASYNQRIAAKL